MTGSWHPRAARIQWSAHSTRMLRRGICGGLFFLSAAIAFTKSTEACQICVPRPTQTLADRLLQSDKVVLAREDAKRPYHYTEVETLKGASDTDAIDLFMNTPVRRQLAADPASAVMLARNRKNGVWRALGIAHDDFERVVRRILSFEGEWTPNEANNLQRLRELAPLLGHDDVRLHELAYLEIGRAPYASIRKISSGVSLEKVRAMLDDPRYLEWRGLDILLLGLSDAEQDQARVVREMEDRRRISSSFKLDAWATAYLEVAGAGGVDQLTNWYLRDARRSRDELRSVISALSVQANNSPGLRGPVLTAYRVLLDHHPHAASDIVRDLITWGQWAFLNQMKLLRPRIADRDPLGLYMVDLYLHRAAAHRRSKQEQ